MTGETDKLTLLTERELIDRLSISRSTLYRWQTAGSFPKRLHIGPGRVAWRACEVEAWILSKAVTTSSCGEEN